MKTKQEYRIYTGLPASGKTTDARYWVEQDPKNRIRVNRDDIRRSLGPYWIPSREKLVTQIEDGITLHALYAGYSVVSDNTNLNEAHWLINRPGWAAYGFENVEVVYKDFTNITPQECIRRDNNRGKDEQVGAKVILRMTKAHLSNKYLITKREETKLLSRLKFDPRLEGQVEWKSGVINCYIFDLDGTLSLMNGRSAYDGESCASDKPNQPLIDTLNYLNEDNEIIIMSGRNGESRPQTIEWLEKYDIPYDQLYMRTPKDQRKDSVIKEEMYNSFVKGRYNVQGVFDDRNMMVDHWRSMGLPCYQVYYGDF